MSIFSKKKKEELLSPKEDLNLKYKLPFNKINDTYQGHDFYAKYVSYDTYQVNAINNNSYNWGLAAIAPVYYPGVISSTNTQVGSGTLVNSSIMNGTYTINAIMMAQVFSNVNLPNLNLFRISKEEEKRLNELEKELEQFKKYKRIEKFKQLPITTRQDIVDTIMLEELINSFHIKETEFENIQEILTLRAMKPFNHTMNWSHSGIGGYQQTSYLQMKYGEILKYLTKEEILAAHAEAAFEEEVLK